MPEQSELKTMPGVPSQKQTFGGRVHKAGLYLRKQWWRLLLSSPLLLIGILKWLLRGLGEDRLMGGLNRFIDDPNGNG